MIKGIGIDIITIDRIKQLYEKSNKFVARILTVIEREQFEQLKNNRKWEYLAGRFCAKEALAKANGTGIGKALSFLDITVLNDQNGKPYIQCDKIKEKIHVSISHFDNIVTSQVILEDSDG